MESQRPERVRFDLAAELHLKFDAVAVAYRKAMRTLGFAASAPGPVPAPQSFLVPSRARMLAASRRRRAAPGSGHRRERTDHLVGTVLG